MVLQDIFKYRKVNIEFVWYIDVENIPVNFQKGSKHYGDNNLTDKALTVTYFERQQRSHIGQH